MNEQEQRAQRLLGLLNRVHTSLEKARLRIDDAGLDIDRAAQTLGSLLARWPIRTCWWKSNNDN